MYDFYRNDKGIIYSKLEEVKFALIKESINIEIEAAAEYYLDEYFLNLINSDIELLTFGDNYVLFELSFVSKPMILREAIFNMQTKGYKPVLAHAERYLYYHKSFDELIELHNIGLLLQLNLISLSGYYSKEAKKIANKLLNKNMISFIGSDCHNTNQLNFLAETLNSSVMNSLVNNKILNSKL
jgi:tyrosine-protein phosphatase YwqE